MSGRYEKEAYQFLAVYRFLAYALAVMFTQVSPSLFTRNMPDAQLYIILGTLGVYSALKVFAPLRWQASSLITYLILFGDFLLCILLVVYTKSLQRSSELN